MFARSLEYSCPILSVSESTMKKFHKILLFMTPKLKMETKFSYKWKSTILIQMFLRVFIPGLLITAVIKNA